MPLVGSRASTTLMLKKACRMIIARRGQRHGNLQKTSPASKPHDRTDTIQQEIMTLKRVKVTRPSDSYQLDVPQNICEQVDERVSSFWLDGNPVLLQLSSYIRAHGKQLTAKDRLNDHIAKNDYKWNRWKTKIHPDQYIDQATAEFVDEGSLLWIHTYLVWPHLTIYSIISGPEELIRNLQGWPFEALKSLRLTTH
jgi:hypothetical protein